MSDCNFLSPTEYQIPDFFLRKSKAFWRRFKQAEVQKVIVEITLGHSKSCELTYCLSLRFFNYVTVFSQKYKFRFVMEAICAK